MEYMMQKTDFKFRSRTHGLNEELRIELVL